MPSGKLSPVPVHGDEPLDIPGGWRIDAPFWYDAQGRRYLSPPKFPEPLADESWPTEQAGDAGVGVVFSQRDGCYGLEGPDVGVQAGGSDRERVRRELEGPVNEPAKWLRKVGELDG